MVQLIVPTPGRFSHRVSCHDHPVNITVNISMSERVLCKKSNCSNLILQTTADDNDGYCMPCVQLAARKEHEEFIRKNRRDVNEFEGITDSVEVLKIVHKPRRYDQLINWIPHPTSTDELYQGLTEAERIRFAEYAEGLIGTDRNEEAEEICLCLTAFCDASLDNCLRRFISHKSFWPSLAFHHSPSDVRDELLTRVEVDENNRNHILLALAWIGDSAVIKRFERWRIDPPSWCDSLYIPLENYSHEAGWELTCDGSRRDLYFLKCHALRRGPSQSPDSFLAISERTDTCPWCSRNLTNLFEVDPALCELSLDSEWKFPIRVVTCEVCTVFAGIIFGVTGNDGQAKWSSKNVRPEYLPDDSYSWGRLPKNTLCLSERRSATFAADQFLPTAFSQIGGHPTWVQNSAYPNCPECSETMMFLAQVAHEDIEEFSEGTYYAFLCPMCKTTATAYQQT